ncbi:MAG TPA: redoxin family protein [Candidatus Paceibacterota bacterium]
MRMEYAIGLLVLVVAGVGLAILYTPVSPKASKGSPSSVAKQQGDPYREIANPAGFVNTDGITIKELVGTKVIIVDFMTYSCINCQRTFPYLNAWYKKYKDQGLEIVGIHTPEFAFEKNIDNVRDAMKRFGIMHPVVLDNDYGTWNAYGNRYWPNKYVIDIHGNIVYSHAGEGAYEETEMKIQELLRERAEVLGSSVAFAGELASSDMPPLKNFARSPETYFGAWRNEYFANGMPGREGEQTHALPDTLMRNALYLDGTWNIEDQFAESVRDSSVFYRYNAGDVFIVADADNPISVEVFQDGKRIDVAAGADVRDGIVTMQESRLYKLIHNREPGEHTLELRVGGKGLRFYAFTFG